MYGETEHGYLDKPNTSRLPLPPILEEFLNNDIDWEKTVCPGNYIWYNRDTKDTIYIVDPYNYKIPDEYEIVFN